MLYYSKSQDGFFDDAIHATLPSDAVEITIERHRQLLQDQCVGKIIVGDDTGQPVSVDPSILLDLDGYKKQIWERVKALRTAHIDAGCQVAGLGTFNADAESRLNINGAVTGALLAKSTGAAFLMTWKRADNMIVDLDADQMIYVGQTILTFVAACHGHAQTLLAAIHAASDKAGVDAVAIDQGWPA